MPALLVAVAMTTLAGCSSKAGHQVTPTVSISPNQTANAQLQPKLLTKTDLPGTWYFVLPDVGQGATACPNSGQTVNLATVPGVPATLTSYPPIGRVVLTEVATQATAAQVEAVLRDEVAVAKRCPKRAIEANGEKLTLRQSVLSSVPNLGDQTVGVQTTYIQPSSSPEVTDYLLIRKGDLLIQLSLGASRSDLPLLEQAATIAVRKLA